MENELININDGHEVFLVVSSLRKASLLMNRKADKKILLRIANELKERRTKVVDKKKATQ